MDPNEIDWSELITRSILQQAGPQPSREDIERFIAELRQAQEDPEGAGIGRQLRALGLPQLAGPEGMVFVRQIIGLTLQRLETMGIQGAEPGQEPSEATTQTHARARAALEAFLRPGADHEALTAQLRPRPEDYALVFEAAYAAVAQQAYERIWDEARPVARPKPGQRELLLASAASDIIRGEGAPKVFPAGFARVAHTLQPGRTWFCWKFVRPGERVGMAFDGLVDLGDRFAWFPKTWRVLGKIDA
jgi:hypothetical protein